MATIKARGQVTIVDLNDAKQVQLLMDIKYPVQMYNPDTKVFTPNFGSDNTWLLQRFTLRATALTL